MPSNRLWRLALTLALGPLLALGTVACDVQPTRGAKARRYQGPQLQLPTSTAIGSSATFAAAPAWLSALKRYDAVVEAEPWPPGERVWAAVPRGPQNVEVAVYRMVGTFDGLVSLLDRRGQRLDGVPPALVHRAGRIGKLLVGDTVLCDAPTAPGVLARVVDLEGAITVVHRWGKGTKQVAVDHAEAAREEVTPLAYVSYPQDGGRGRGLVLALAEGWVWLRDGSGSIRQLPRGGVRPVAVLNVVEDDQRVTAFSWPSGARSGRVSVILGNGVQFVVTHDDGTSGYYFFAQLTYDSL